MEPAQSSEASNFATTASKRGGKRGRGKAPGGAGRTVKGVKLRGLPTDSEEVRYSKTLSWLLRHAAKSEGIPMRPDGYVRVSDLLAHNKLRDLDFPTLEQLVKSNDKQRYIMVCEPEGGNDIWWIRANQGHSMKSVELNLKPITSAADIPMAVHGTSLDAWRSISKQGLSKMARNHIHLAQGTKGSGVISGMRANAQVLIFIDIQKALDAGVKFYLSENGVVLSDGDERGYISPDFFERAERTDGKPMFDWRGDRELRKEAKQVLEEGTDDVAPTSSEAIPTAISS